LRNASRNESPSFGSLPFLSILRFRRLPQPPAGGPGRWSLPGGYLEVGEDYQAAAIREGLEETGLAIIPEGISSVISNRFESGAETLAIVFLATASPGAEFRAGDDLVELRWIAAGDEMPDLAFEADMASIQRYWFGDDAVVRPYSGFFSAV
jgi:8-oxo-dGTP diphosphatase